MILLPLPLLAKVATMSAFVKWHKTLEIDRAAISVERETPTSFQWCEEEKDVKQKAKEPANAKNRGVAMTFQEAPSR